MPNDTDTDIEDVEAPSEDTEGPPEAGFDTSDQQPLATPATTGPATPPPPSARNQPMELPGSLAGSILGGLGGNTQPVGAQVQQRHGGLLTGLAGVLLDGLAAGMAPTAAMASQMPIMRQQQQLQAQQLQLQQQKMQEELAEAPVMMQAKVAQARLDMFRAEEMSREFTWEVKSGLTQARAKAVEGAIERGDANDLATAPTLEEAQHMVEQESQKNKTPNRQIDYYPGPLNPDGSPQNYHIYEWYPANTLKQDVDFDLPEIPGMPASEGEPAIPAVPAKHMTFHAGTSMADMDSVTKRLGAEHTAAGASLREGIEARRETRAEQVDVRKLDEPHVVFMKNGDKRIMEEGQALEAERSGQASFHTKADMKQIQSAQLGMNDLQNSINTLAEVNFKNVQPGLAAALIEQDDSIDATAKAGILGDLRGMIPQRFMTALRSENIKQANQDTRNFVASLPLAYEGLSQLPRLQTMAQVNRSSQTQIEATRGTLPKPGEDAAMAKQRITMLQRQLLDPVRRGLPHGPGLELDKAWNESGYQPKGFAISSMPGEGGVGRGAGPQKGDSQSYRGFTYKFDGDQWVKQK